MAVDAHCLLPVRGRGAADRTEAKRRHGDCAVDLASTPHDAVGPPATEAESGGGASFADAAAPSRKRARGAEEDQFVGAAKRRVIDVHPAVLHHVQKLSAEVQQWRRYAAAASAAVARRLRAKDEEIDAARRLGRVLQEQARAARAEARAWRDAAVSGEAAAAALRADLDDALRARARRDEAESAAAEDAGSSCCSGSNGDDDATTGSSVARACRGCGDRDAAVVLLPCRHLSACAPCAAAARACPACGFPKAGIVAVNLV